MYQTNSRPSPGNKNMFYEIARIFSKSQSLYREGEFGKAFIGTYKELENLLGPYRGLGRNSRNFSMSEPIIYKRRDLYRPIEKLEIILSPYRGI